MSIAPTISASEEKPKAISTENVSKSSIERNETLIEAAEASPAIAAPGIVLDGEIDKKPDLPKTRGEWFYDVVQQIGGKTAIIAATAFFAYVARYGRDSYGPVPNLLKKFQSGFHKLLKHNSVYPMAEKGEVVSRLADAAANTMVTFHGGNIFSPIMKALENNRENIANWYNRKWGKPGDVEIAHERLKDEPKQTWGDIVKGRIAAWLLVFTAFSLGDIALGKGTLFGKGASDKHRLDQYEEAFGRWLAGFTKKGKAIWETPLVKELTNEQKQNKVYQFGKITALDLYATNAGILIWSFFSRKSAKKRQNEQAALANGSGTGQEGVETKKSAVVSAEAVDCAPCRLKSFATSMSPSERYTDVVAGEKAKASEASLAQSV